jgi:hypothetical protein
MGYKCYKGILLIVFSLLAILFLSQKPVMQNEQIGTLPVVNIVYFYAPTILSLCALYISFYAYISRVEPVKKSGRPVTAFCSICALLCLVFSLTPPIVGYLSLANIEVDQKNHGSEDEGTFKFFSSTIPLANRHEARLHYRKTKELAEYVNKKGKKVIYSPDKIDKLYYENIQSREHLQESVASVCNSVKILVFITIVSLLGFLLFLKYKNPGGTSVSK